MKKQPPTIKTEPLSSPFEAAQIAISLAIMRGEKEPDVEGALKLLQRTATRVQNEERPKLPIFHLVEAGKSFVKARAFPGGDKIIVPKGDHFTFAQVVRAAIGRKDNSRNETVIRAARKANVLSESDITETDFSEVRFWKIAAKIAPFVPRFKTLYPKAKARKQPRHVGKFYVTKGTGRGEFKKA